jgi:zinc protease
MLVNALAPGSPAPAAAITVRPFGVSPRRLVTSRAIGVPFVVLGFDAPGIGDADFPAALVMKTLLSDVLEPTDSPATLPAALRTSDTQYTYDMKPAQLSVWLNGGRVDPTQALSAFDAVLKRVASEPVDAAAIAHFRDRARGEWILQNITLEARAAEVGNAVAHGLDPDYASSIDDAIAHVTAADVLRVAKKYFVHFDVALVLPRDATGG